MTDLRCFSSDEGRVELVILKRKTKVFKHSLKLDTEHSDDDDQGGSGRDFALSRVELQLSPHNLE